MKKQMGKLQALAMKVMGMGTKPVAKGKKAPMKKKGSK